MTMRMAAVEPAVRRAMSAWTLAFAALLVLAFTAFVALGVWQLQRMGWKQDLIARVNARIHAEPVAPPPRVRWATITEQSDGYRRIHLTGEFLPVREARTQAVTALGAGSWVLSPLRTTGGDIIFVNRGFVPTGQAVSPATAGRIEIVGLLRISEPGGGFLRSNRPAEDRWYSRDVAAIARARGLPVMDVAPFFVDVGVDHAGGASVSPRWPRGGLTVVHFRDTHLSYALTWFALALLSVLAGGWLLVSRRRMRQDDD